MKIIENEDFSFHDLVQAIQLAHDQLAGQAAKAVNVSLTLRNWLIGFYIREYEQNGADRAEYGANLLDTLSVRLIKAGMRGIAPRTLRQYRQFYLFYPQIRQTLSAKSSQMLLSDPIWQSLSARFAESDAMAIQETLSSELIQTGKELLERLSFSHFAELIAIDEPVKRTFYEVECIRGNWSVRELKRQIASLYYERSGLSENKEKLAELAGSDVETASPHLSVRDPYVFEFLGLRSKEVMRESDLEESLLDKLQDFLLELGHGFCFEARQKRILIGDEYFFVDLVFYHRILKCHVLIELKVDDFGHEYVGQLNTYVNWYMKNEMSEGDNSPIGILLCTKKNNALVEYALAGMDNNLFVSKYLLELPKKEEMLRFLEEQMR